jgi:hypothetical protein
MIKIHRENRIIFWLLIGGLVLNILWSLRLELQAKTITTIVEKYHLNLNKNADTLIGLKKFLREADEISVKTNNQSLGINMESDNNRINISTYRNLIRIGDLNPAPNGSTNGISLFAGSTVGESAEIQQTSKGIRLNLGDASKPFYLNMGRDKELIEIRHRDSFFQVGEAPVGDRFYQGIFMGEKNSATLAITKDEGIGLRSLKEINLALGKQSNDSEPFHLNMSRDKELIEIRHRGSFFQVGKAPVEDGMLQGIVMGEKNSATLAITKDEGIGLITEKKIKLEAKGELSIVAEGDINIQSKNGVVRINGKKIHMNE